MVIFSRSKGLKNRSQNPPLKEVSSPDNSVCAAVAKNKASPQFLLHWQVIFLFVIAFLAAWHHISLACPAAPGDGYDMIHGQLFGRDRTPAVVAHAFCTSAFPPLGSPEFPCFPAFPFDVRFFQPKGKGVCQRLSRHFLISLFSSS